MSRIRGRQTRPRRPRKLLRLLTSVLLVAGLTAVGVVTAPAASAAVIPFASVYSTQDNGAITLVGNSQMSCPTAATGCPAGRIAAATSTAQSGVNDNDFAMAFVDQDSDNTTGNSTSADLSLPSGSTVLSAFLVWGGRRNDSTNTTTVTPGQAKSIKFRAPGATAYTSFTDGILTDPALTSTTDYNPYQGYRDVTAIVKAAGNGTYWAADISATTGGDRYAGWSLVVAYRNPAAPLRDLRIYQGFNSVSGTATATIPISGFLTPTSGAVSSAVGVVAWEGDRGFVGDGMQFGGQLAADGVTPSTTGTTLSDATRPANNFFNSAISDSGTPLTARNPNFPNNFGVDIGRINGTNVLANGQTSTYVQLRTNGDTYYPGIVTTQIDLFTPAFNPISKSVVNLSGNSPAQVGDTLRYQVSLTNTGADPADNSVITDVLPTNTTYVPGSLVLEANPGSAPSLSQTDAADADQAEYLAGSRTVRFRVGQGANGTSGGTIGVNQTVTIQFRVTLDRPSAGTTVSNVSNLSYLAHTIGKTFTFVGNQVDTPVAGLADLAITKTSNPTTQTAGSNVTYQLTATNNGPNAASNVVLTDNLPAGVTFVSAAPPAGTSCSPSGQVVTCTSSVLANGGTLVVPITTTVAPGTASGTALTDVASVSSDTGDDVTGNNSASATTQITTSADVALTKTVSPNPVAAGAPVTYTLRASNNGPSTANAVTITDPLPLGLNYTSSTPAGVCSNNNGVLTCAVGALAPNASSTVTITAGVASNVAAGTISNTATASSTTPDPVSSNNSATAPVTVNTSADLSITKTPTPSSVVAGTSVSYALTVRNNGPSDAAGVVVSDPAVAGLSILSAASSQGTCTVSAGSVSCPIGSLVANGSVTVTVQAQVSSTTSPGTLNNTASVTSTTADPVGGNNSATGTVTVTNSADMALSKSANPGTITPGSPVTYNLSAYNNGPSSATNVVITDTLPAALTFTSGSPGCTAAGQIVTCVVGTVANQATPTVTITAATSGAATGTITNTAVVTSDNDPNSANNQASAVSSSSPQADLVMSKTGSVTAVAGSTASYTLRVHNNGPSAANNVTVTDVLPVGLSFASVSTAGGLVCTGTTTVKCAVATLPSGANTLAVVSVTVDSTFQGSSITNSATVSSATTDPTPGNNTDSATTTITTQADVGVVFSTPATPVVAGTTTTFSLTVDNRNGPSTARNVVVTGQVPPGLIPVLGSSGGACVYNAGTGTVTCHLPDIPAGATLPTITFQATVDPSQPAGDISGTATVGSDTPDPNASNNSSSTTVHVITSADLSMAKSVTPNPLIAGAAATYTLTATNNGPSDAQNVQIIDDLPAGLAIVSANPTLGSCIVTGQHIACTAATVQANSALTVSVVTKVASAATGSISNTASVTSATTDPTPGNNSATISTPVIQTAHLTMTKTADAEPIVAGSAVTYTLSIVNNGPSDALNVVLTDPLPAGFTVLSNGISSTGDVCPQQPNATTVTCSFGTVAAGGVRTVQITASTPAALTTGSTVTNTATLASPTQDSDPSGRTASVTSTVTTSADLSISKAPVTDPIEAGAQQTYVLQITNNGPSVSRGVVVTDALPAGVTFVSVVPATGCTTGSTVTCSLGDLGRSATATLQITVQLASNIGGTTLANTATVASSPASGAATPDPNTGNNSSTVSQKVATRSDLSLTKTISSGAIVAGSAVTYQMVATNNGPSDTTNMVLTDPLPAGTTLVTANASDGGSCQLANPVVCSWPSVPNGASRTVGLTVAVPPSAAVGDTVTNTATVTSQNLNTTPDASTATATAPVTASADVSVVKTLLSGNPVAGGAATWQLVVHNAGPSQAANVVLDDTAPAGVTFTATTPSASCAIASNALHCGFGVLAANTSVTATVTGTLAADYTADTVTNAATAGSDTFDPDTSNNSSSATADTTTSADLSLAKVATSSPFVAGNAAGWTVTVSNAGPSTAANAVVTDVVPAGVTGAAATVVGGAACTSAPGTGANAGSTVLTCPVGSVSTTTPVQISVTGTVIASLIDPSVTNNATVAATTPDPNSGNNSASSTTPVTASADLSLTKAGPAVAPHSGQSISWTLTVGNAGPSDAQGATVTDTLPAGLTAVSGTGPGGACSVNGTSVTCAVGTVASGSTATVTVSATVGPDTVGTLHNTATVTSSTTDPNPDNNTGTSDTTVNRAADVSVTKTFIGSSAVPGDAVSWTIVAGNAGPSTATAVVVTDSLPAAVTGITATFGSMHTACTVTGQDVSCALGSLAVGTAVNIAVTGTLASSDTATTLDNTATISSPDDPDSPAQNSATSSTPVRPSADLSIGKALTSGPPVGGAAGTYTLTVGNAGPSDATNATITDQLPNLFRNATVSLTGATGTCNIAGNDLTCTIGSVPVGTAPKVTINGVFDQNLGSTISNTAQISADTPDPVTANNSSTATGSLGESADLRVSKTGPTAVVAGDTITWTVQVTNDGPSDARDVTVSDTVPNGVTGATATLTGGATCAPANCAVGTIPEQTTVTVTVTGTVSSGFLGSSLVNTVTASGSTPDPDGSNNQASSTTSVTTAAHLTVAKTVTPDPLIPGRTASYVVTVSNSGLSDAQANVATDPVPNGLTVAPAGPGASQGSCQMIGRTASCQLGVLAAGRNAVITIPVIVDAGFSGTTVTNTATVSSPTPDTDPDPAGRTGSVTTDVTPLADLTLIKTGPAAVLAGNGLTWTLTLSNAGPSVARDVVITDTVPVPVTGLSASATQGSCTFAGNIMTCDIGILAAGDSARITLFVTGTVDPASTITSLTNTATVASSTPEPNPNPDQPDGRSSTWTTAVSAQANLVVAKAPKTTSFTAGGPASWTITVTNLGPSTAANATATDTLPAGLDNPVFADAQGNPLTCPAGVCSLGTIAPNTAVSITVSGTVDSAFADAFIVNGVTAHSDTADPVEGNNTVTSQVPVTTSAHLNVVKQGPVSVIAGNTISWTIDVSNTGSSTARNVHVADDLPTGISGITFTAPAGVTCPANPVAGTTATCDLPDLAAGAPAVRITVSAIVDSDHLAGSIDNTARATTSTPQSGPVGDDTSHTTTPVTTRAQLSISKTGPTGPVTAGNPITWTVQVNNAGPSVARAVVVTDPAPTGVTGFAGTWSGGTCAQPCALGDLPSGGTVTITYKATVQPDYTGDTLSNTASLTSTTPTGPGGNDEATAETDINRAADLSVTKQPSAASFTAGKPASWTITVTNGGPSTATNATVTDTLPAGLDNPVFADAQGNPLTCPAGVCPLGTLAPNTAVSITVSGTIDSDFSSDSITNVAVAHSDTADPVTGNNTAESNVPVTASAHLVVVKQGPVSVIAGKTVTWTIDVSNTGFSTARNVHVADDLPTGISGITLTAPAGVTCPANPVAGTTATCDLPDLAAGAPTVTITVSATVNGDFLPGSMDNTARATTSTPQSGPVGDDTGHVSTPVTTLAQLSISKTGPTGSVTAGNLITWTVKVSNAGPSVARAVVVDDPTPAGVTGFAGSWSGGTCAQPCALGNLPPGGSVTITYTATVNSGFVDNTLSNTATVDSSTPGGGAQDTAHTDITRSADLSLVKTVSPDPVTPGRPVTYTLTVHNAGLSDATGVQVTDPLPAALLNASAPGCTIVAGTLSCPLGTLASGATTTVTVTATVAPDVDPSGVSNTASVTATTPDPDLSNNSSTVSAGTAQANLSVTKKPSAPSVRPSGTLAWTITSTNHGSGPARNTVVTDRIPDGTTLVGVKTSQGSCTSVGQVVTCSIGTVQPGALATVVITAKVAADRTGTLTNAATVLSPDESDPSDNVAQATTPVTAVADLSLTKKVTSGAVVAGRGVTWQLVVTNQGPAAAPAVVITDPVPSAVTGLKVSTGCTISGGTVRCAVGSLAAGKSATVTISGTVAPTARGSLTNTATAASAVPDPNPQNNTATTTTPVGLDSALTVTKTADVASVAVSGTVTYTIRVAQSGRSVSNAVTVTESLPDGASVVGTLASQGGYAAGIWAVGTIAPGGTATLTLTVQMGQSGTAVNAVELTESGTTTKASAQATVTVIAPPPPNPTPPHDLPNTGFAATRFLLLGLALLLGGAVLMLGGRRRRSALR